MRGLSVPLTLLGVLATSPGLGQENPPSSGQQQSWSILNQAPNNPDLFSFDYGIPDSPALALAGVGGTSLQPASSLKPFVLSLPGLIGSDSSQTSAALDTALPWLFSEGRSVSPRQYEDEYPTQLWFRTRLGLALYKGQESASDPTATKPSRVAVGLSTSFLPESDPVTARYAGDSATAWESCLDANKSAIEPHDAYDTAQTSMLHSDMLGLDIIVTDMKLHTGNGAFELDNREQDDLSRAESHLAQTLNWTDDQVRQRQRLALGERVAADQVNIRSLSTPESQAQKDAEAKVSTVLQQCQKQATDAAQHGASLQLGAGVVWSGDPGKWANFGDPNAAIWIAGRYPLLGRPKLNECGDQDTRAFGEKILSCWMMGGTGRYSAGEMVSTGDSTTPEFKANVLEGWLGLERIDSKSKFGGYFGYLQQHATDSAQDRFSKGGTRWLISAAFNLGGLGGTVPEGLWIQGSYGAANGSVTTLDDKVALLSLSFGPPSLASTFQPRSSSASGASGSGGNSAGSNPGAGATNP
jgi:hypothetical protein